MILPGIRFFSTARMPSIAPSRPDDGGDGQIGVELARNDFGQHRLHVVERRAAGADEVKLLLDVGVEINLGGLVGGDAGEDVDDGARGGGRDRLRHQRRHRRHQHDVIELLRQFVLGRIVRAQRELVLLGQRFGQFPEHGQAVVAQVAGKYRHVRARPGTDRG